MIMATKWNEIQDSNTYKALNPQEQSALQRRYFDNVIFKSDTFNNLSLTEQSALKTKFFSQGAIGQQQQQNVTDTQLIDQLRGELPLSQQTLIGLPIQKEALILDPSRQKAFNALIAQGKTPEQIQFILDINKKVKAPPILGRTIGAIALPLIAGRFIPGPIDDIALLAKALKASKTVEGTKKAVALMKAVKRADRIRKTVQVGTAGLGGGLGEAAQIGIEEKRLLSKGEFLKAVGKELAFEGASRGVVRTVKFAASPFIKRTIPEAAALVEDLGKFGGVFDPTALDSRFTTSVFTEVSRGAFGARQVWEEMGQKSGRAARIYSQHLLDLMADSAARLGPEQLGKEFAEAVTRPNGFVFRQVDDLIDVLYKQLDDLTESRIKRIFKTRQVPSVILDETGRPVTRPARRAVGKKLVGKLAPGFEELEEFVPVGVSTRKLKQFWIKTLQKNKEVLKQGKKGAFLLTPAAIKEGESVIRDLANVIPHKRMRGIRSRVLRDIKKLHRDIGQDEALIKQYEQVTFNILTDPASVRGATPEIQNLFNNTRNLYKSLREGIETIFPEAMAKRFAKNPSVVIKELFQRNNPTAIRNLRISLTEPIKGIRSKEGEVLWKQLRTAWFDDAVEQATRGEIIKPTVFENIVRRQGKATIAEMLPDATGRKQLRTIQDLLTAMSKKPAAGASLFIRGTQVGGGVMVYQGIRDGDYLQVSAGSVMVMGPYAFAKLAGHPLGSRLLATGIKLKPGSTALVGNMARIINLARQIDREEITVVEKARRLKRHIRGAPARREARKFSGSF